MKLSKYNYLFKSDKYGYLNYNSVTNSFIALNDELYNALINNDFANLNNRDLTKLRELKIIVNENFDRDFYLESKTVYYNGVFHKNTLSLTIAPTIDCNFDCVYCYEVNRIDKKMSFQTADKIIEFIKSYNHLDDIEITWYGGEPLLAVDEIEYLFTKISELNIPFSDHGMITNGFLINEKSLRLLKKLKLNYIQFTLDGKEETHNKKRRHKNHMINTYGVILNNVGKFIDQCPNTDIYIRVHVDTKNKKEFYSLYKELSGLWNSDKIYIYPAFIRDDINNCATGLCTITDQKNMYEFYQNLYKHEGHEVNFFPKVDIGGCHANNINSYVVGPDGELYKCWNDIGIENRIVGFVDSNKIVNKNLMFQYLIDASKFEDEACKECFLLPVCSGGCPYLRVDKNKSGKDNYPLLCSLGKDHLKELLEMHYEQQLNKSESVTCIV